MPTSENKKTELRQICQFIESLGFTNVSLPDSSTQVYQKQKTSILIRGGHL